MAYTILRFAKHKGSPARAIEAHHEREKEEYKSNPDIIKSKIKDNIHLIKPNSYYRYEIENRIKTAACRTRKDSTRFVDTLITASPEFFSGKSVEEITKYFLHSLEFIKTKIKDDNIFSAVIHMDEKSPHMHLCFVPLTEDNRLSAKDILGNRASLSKWQDGFYEHMTKYYEDLERGESAMITKRKHIPTNILKSAVKLKEMQSEIENILQNTNAFNSAKNTKKAVNLIEKWIPKVETFETKINLLNKSLQESEKNNKGLTNEILTNKDTIFSYHLQISGLRQELARMKKLYSKVPDVIKEEIELKRKTKEAQR